MYYLTHHLWPHVVALTIVAVALTAAGHVVLYKRDLRSAVGWIGLIGLLPFFGAILYALFGVNRIQRRAATMRRHQPELPASPEPLTCDTAELEKNLSADARHLSMLARGVGDIGDIPLLRGNTVTPLQNGDEAYPEMLAAIETACSSITFSSYIFAHDKTGLAFADALVAASHRGVEVRVLVDYVGMRYSFPSIVHRLHHGGVKAAEFMPTFVPWRTPYMNLRNHRKILVVDGKLGFTGGINIRIDNLHREHPSEPVRDLHFKMTGPVVGQLQEIFAEDWAFTTHEILDGGKWFPKLEATGPVIARGIPDGPDEDLDKLRKVIMMALACSQKSVRIVTPYFLPDLSLIAAMNTTVMRGVSVEIVIPERPNLRAVGWAATGQLWQILEHGCRLWLAQEPFDHTKLMIVDDVWSLIGSANWDPRSLRLNFEFDVECYDADLATRLNELFVLKREHAREATIAEVDARPLPIRLRDGVARLFSPYL